VIVVFSEPVKFRDGALVILEAGKPAAAHWVPAHHLADHYSYVWSTLHTGDSSPVLKVDAAGVLAVSPTSRIKADLTVPVSAVSVSQPNSSKHTTQKKEIFNEEMLQNELASVLELVELEPDSKCKEPTEREERRSFEHLSSFRATSHHSAHPACPWTVRRGHLHAGKVGTPRFIPPELLPRPP